MEFLNPIGTLAAALLTPIAATQATAPPAATVAAEPSPLPAEVRQVIEAAIKSGDAAAVSAVVRFSKLAHPDAEGEIDALHSEFKDDLTAKREREAEKRRARIAAAGPLQGWKGQVEIGATRSTGSVENLGLFGSLAADREGLEWRHKLEARAEIQETNNFRSAERYLASWQPRYRLDDKGYAFGLVQYDHDPFLGFSNRYTIAVGAGYSVLDTPTMKLEVEGGPAVRHTDALLTENIDSLGGRASLDFSWKITPVLEVKQNGSFFLEEGTGSGRSLSALDTMLLGAFRLRLSHELRFERNVLKSIDRLDTTSRATVVYAF